MNNTRVIPQVLAALLVAAVLASACDSGSDDTSSDTTTTTAAEPTTTTEPAPEFSGTRDQRLAACLSVGIAFRAIDMLDEFPATESIAVELFIAALDNGTGVLPEDEVIALENASLLAAQPILGSLMDDCEEQGYPTGLG